MQDFSQLSSRTVTEVLMLEMKMAPAAKAYLVSGFPRSMRDVVEYQEKVNGQNNKMRKSFYLLTTTWEAQSTGCDLYKSSIMYRA